MKTRLIAITTLVLVLALPAALVLLIGCGSQPTPTPVPTATPIPTVASTPAPTATPTPTSVPISAVVLGMVERMNAGDLEGSLAYFADDAMVYFVGMPPTGMEIYRGKEQLRPVWEECIGSHFKWEVEITSVVGDVVNARAKTWHDFTRELGVAPNEFTDVYVVKDGKIVTYGSTITEEALAKFKPALAAVMPPEPPAAPSSENPVSEMTVTIAGETCTYDGPMTLQAGEIKVTMDVKDQDKELYALTFFNLDPDKDFTDLMASTAGAGPPPWSDMLLFEELGPGKSETYSFTVEEGPVYLICWSKPPDLPIGAVGPFEVQQ
ncbi:MAG: nuclear transport factor 2 family protein [Anaerolineae bacterium]|nr:nuclear transport factor 2 family protein [Anaerolineae bacterium]